MATEKNPVIQEAYCKLQVMSEDEANRMLYEARLKAQRDEYSHIRGARRCALPRFFPRRWSFATTGRRFAFK
jgi:hypothetical protein